MTDDETPGARPASITDTQENQLVGAFKEALQPLTRQITSQQAELLNSVKQLTRVVVGDQFDDKSKKAALVNKVDNNSTTTDANKTRIDALDAIVTKQDKALAVINVRIGIGSTVGGAIVSGIVVLAFKLLGG